MASMPFVVLVAFGGLAIAGLLEALYRAFNNRRRLHALPGPPHSWLWGHLKVMGEAAAAVPPHAHPQLYIKIIAQKYDLKGIFYLDLWPAADSMVCLTTPELMNQVQVTKPLLMHKASNDFMAPVVGNNVIATANGPVWKKLAHAMSPAFAPAHIRSLTDLFVDELLLFRNTLDMLAATGQVFSVEKEAAKLIFDVIARIVFNFPLHAQTKGSKDLNDFHEMIQLVEAQLSYNPFVKMRSYIRRQFLMRRTDASIKKNIQERFDLLRKDKIIPSRKDPLSILDLMLRETIQESSGPVDKLSDIPDLSAGDMALLITNVKGLLIGGHGTTTDTLCYVYMLLSKNPSVVKKLCDEHTRVFAADTEKTISILRDQPAKLTDLEYTAAVIRETLRLFPVGFNPRQAHNPEATITYEGKDYPIGHGLMVLASAHMLHYDKAYHPDADVFRPERWLADPPPDRSLFRTFGKGPRACMGQNLAVDELKIILLLTVRDYEFSMDEGAEWQKPNEVPRTGFSRLDTVYGDCVFQELGLEAKPRGGMMMSVKKVT